MASLVSCISKSFNFVVDTGGANPGSQALQNALTEYVGNYKLNLQILDDASGEIQ